MSPESADATVVEDTLYFIISWPEYAKDRRDNSVEHEWRSRQRTRTSLPRTLSARIPFEVIELIMDKMYQGSLNSCARVCRAWYHASVRVIYRDIAITSRAAFDSLVRFVRDDPRAQERLAQTSSLRIGEHRRDVPVHATSLVFPRAMPNLRKVS